VARLTKNQKVAVSKIEANKAYSLQDASSLVKDITNTKFDSSVDIDVRLGVDPRKANQMVRGIATLAHGTGKTVRVLVLCTPDKEQEAKDAGADFVGLDDYIAKIEGGWTDVDIIITMPSVMAKVGRLGRIIHTSIGKVSFPADKIYENALEVLQTISKLKPSAAKGTYFKSIHISSTMSPGIEIETKTVAGI
jgi:large subunit ribosomal protein L1